MPKLIQGQSDATPYKQDGFMKVLGMLSQIAYYGAKKVNWRPPTTFLYIDCNSGCGFNDKLPGSPLLAIDILACGEKRFDDLVFIFCEADKDRYEQLNHYCKSTYPELNIYLFHGDNNSSAFLNQIKFIAEHHFGNNKMYGLIYSDPNGTKDYPVDLIHSVSRLPQFKMLDILINFNTTAIKRAMNNKRCRPTYENKELSLVVNSISKFKDKQFIREYAPEDKGWKFCHFLFTNFPKAKPYKGINLVDLHSEKGRKLFDEVCYTRKEFNTISQLTMFDKLKIN